MTRIRVLLRAIKLLEQGVVHRANNQAEDERGNPLSYMHPAAVRFNAAGAVQRAILDLTGDPADKRDALWQASLVDLRTQFGGWGHLYSAFEAMTQDEMISTFRKQLEKWQ